MHAGKQNALDLSCCCFLFQVNAVYLVKSDAADGQRLNLISSFTQSSDKLRRLFSVSREQDPLIFGRPFAELTDESLRIVS